MSTLQSVIVLLTINLGLIWLLLAAPVGQRTLTVRRSYRAGVDSIRPALDPRGENSDWYHAVLSSDRLDGGLVRQRLTHPDRKGEPIVRVLEVADASKPGEGIFTYRSRIIEDSALDPSFWQHFHEVRRLMATGDGAIVEVEQTDRYRGLAFLLYRYFALSRELKALDGWLRTGTSKRIATFEHLLTQTGLAVLSTLLLWPFFGLTKDGLLLSTMLTLVIVLHEFGHMAAYRAFGHKRVRMIFVPFLGGIAIGGRPYNSLFEVASCALMGAGMSAFMVPLTIGAYALGASMVSSIALIFLLILGAFNLLNLLPMHRFDGGQVLRQIFPTRNGLVAGTFAVTLAILWVGWRIGLPSVALIAGLAVFTILSLFGGGRAVKPRSALEPITGHQRLAVSLGLAATLSLHAYAIVFACDRLFG